jgi:hypothetical protein
LYLPEITGTLFALLSVLLDTMSTDPLTPDQRAVIQRTRYVARFLDNSVGIPGTRFRFGADTVLGIVPVIGDVLASLLSLYIVLEAIRAGISRKTIAQMCLNIVIDTAVGVVPLIGTLFDMVWKANERNVSLLERRLSQSSIR